jgi:hypothetical protein
VGEGARAGPAVQDLEPNTLNAYTVNNITGRKTAPRPQILNGTWKFPEAQPLR